MINIGVSRQARECFARRLLCRGSVRREPRRRWRRLLAAPPPATTSSPSSISATPTSRTTSTVPPIVYHCRSYIKREPSTLVVPILCPHEWFLKEGECARHTRLHDTPFTTAFFPSVLHLPVHLTSLSPPFQSFATTPSRVLEQCYPVDGLAPRVRPSCRTCARHICWPHPTVPSLVSAGKEPRWTSITAPVWRESGCPKEENRLFDISGALVKRFSSLAQYAILAWPAHPTERLLARRCPMRPV